jgi:hypothetical protein
MPCPPHRPRFDHSSYVWRGAQVMNLLINTCHHGMARPQVADGDSLQIWKVAPNILNKQSRTADKGWSFSFGAGRGANKSSP